MNPRGGPPRPLAGFLPPAPAEVLAEAHRLHGAPPPYDPSASSPPPAREPGCDDVDEETASSFEGGKEEVPPEPAPNSPGDAGYLDQEQLAGGVVTPAGSPAPESQPETHDCKSCGARIYWVQLVDEQGARQRRDDGKGWKAMPVDAQPDAVKGNVYCFRPRGTRTLYGRVLRRDEPIPPGARLRTSHFATCPNAAGHRRRGARR